MLLPALSLAQKYQPTVVPGGAIIVEMFREVLEEPLNWMKDEFAQEPLWLVLNM